MASKEDIENTNKAFASDPKVKILGFYWALGRYDSVLITDAPDAKSIMKIAMKVGNFASTETMIAIPREEAVKLL